MVIRYFMGIIKKISNVDSIIWIWKINESSDALSILTDQKTDVKNENKKKEFYASRVLIEKMCEELNILFEGIRKDNNGKPHLIKSKYHISISHKFPYVSVIFNTKKCGIDIERIDEKVKKIRSKFLSKKEDLIVGENLKKLVEYWSMKETAYKVDGTTIPLKNIEIREKIKNLYTCSINGKTIEIKTEEIDGHLLSYTT
tara:strand:- start:1904 stop:2503 length:600 start_codon:yes stop_codon:yes gene_type:complete